jgi:hypothetical protein
VSDLLSVDKIMSVHENLQLHSRESGDCAGMTILAAVMINSRLDSFENPGGMGTSA